MARVVVARTSRPDLSQVAWWRSFVFRFMAVNVLLTVLLVAGSVLWLHEVEKAEIVDKFGLALEAIAATAAPFVEAEDLEEIHADADAERAPFRRVRGVLERMRADNHLRADQVYLLRPKDDEARVMEFVVMLQERTFVGDEYRPPEPTRARYLWIFRERASARTPLYTDDHGTFISGLAPVLDADGRVVAILHVDQGLDDYLAEVDRRTRTLLLGASVFVTLIVLFGLIALKRLRTKVRELLEGTRAIEDEAYDHRLPVRGHDELSTLAQALNQVLSKLKERFEMLKFLPSHTARMIEAAAQADGVHLDLAREVRVAVLETDIRGFTSLSQQLSPPEIITMLNRYVRVQADIVSEHGGSVDKYMGDAVLAVFEGDDMERRAMQAALDVQREVARLNDAGAFERPVRIGAGLSIGEVVMGNMGSEQRMEHTVIGSVVNLAARLCSAAGPGEIVAAAALYDRVKDELALEHAVREEVRVKGFAEPVPCYRFGAAAVGSGISATPG